MRAPAAMRRDAEAAVERIWDLHDRLSDAILDVSRARLLLPPPAPSGGGRNGCVFVKGGVDGAAAAEPVAAAAEARSLHDIRSALEDLEGQLEFLHTVHSQQRAERDAAIARLEQSRQVLAMKLAEHRGRKYRVIDEALKFVDEDVLATHRQSGDDAEGNRCSGPRILANALFCSLSSAKNSFRLDKIGGALGNAAVFAASMLVFSQLHQVAFGCKTPAMEYSFRSGSPQQNGKGKHLEVYLTRG